MTIDPKLSNEAEVRKACMGMIETIFLCLPDVLMGTIYHVGKMPDLVVKRTACGTIDDERKNITWSLPSVSEYDDPGRSWTDYRDEPDRPLEAMAWCIERQKRWTSEDPASDIRHSRPLDNDEGFNHLEPVLVRKSDLNLDMYDSFDYPRNWNGDMIWKDSEYVVVAVLKIQFRPYTIKINSNETRVIKKLAHSLGTEILSTQLRQDSLNTMRQLAMDRLNVCNVLADSLRNAIAKFGLIFSVLKQEIGFLREQWEQILLNYSEKEGPKAMVLRDLEALLNECVSADEGMKKVLSDAHTKFLEICLPPEQGRKWLEMQIIKRWEKFLDKYPQKESINIRAGHIFDELKQSLYFGIDSDIAAEYDLISDDLKSEWIDLIYKNTESFNSSMLDRLINVLTEPSLNIPSREKSRKNLIQLKALAETINDLERNTNFLLNQVLKGQDDGIDREGIPEGDNATGKVKENNVLSSFFQ
ncbi:MAG: hypothetical protein JRJ23_10200 [Deltaproteobacteria bacterium]|nr:hypothetical protein [Deltaproteobacteria bacterium]